MPLYTHNPKWDGIPSASAVRECFGVLEPVLMDFASDHSLLIRKYYHDQSMWSFHWLNPKGGFGAVNIHASSRSGGLVDVAVASHWWVDDQQRGNRASLSPQVRSLQATQPEGIRSLLEETLGRLLARPPSDLSNSSRVIHGKRDEPKYYEFTEFERAQRFPT
jgi:hypothetical protein